MTDHLTPTQLLAYSPGPGHFVHRDLLTLTPVPTPPPHRRTAAPAWYWPGMAVVVALCAVNTIAVVSLIIDGAAITAAVLSLAVVLCLNYVALRGPHRRWAAERAALAERADRAVFGAPKATAPHRHRSRDRAESDLAEWRRNVEQTLQAHRAARNRTTVDGIESQRPLLDNRVLRPNAQTREERQHNIEIVQARIAEGRDTFTGELLPADDFLRVEQHTALRTTRGTTA